jgi:hypothetical protein
MGCSAGSIATQAWSSEILTTFKYKKAAVVPDSYIGVFPPDTQGPLIYDFGACTTDILPKVLEAECLNQTLTLQKLVLTWLADMPTIPFTFIQSKVDSTQMSFYVALAISQGQNPVITQREFYNQVNEIMEQYNQYDNFVTYLVDGSQHCFTPLGVYYTAGPLGPREGSSDDPLVHEWVESLPLDSGQSIATVCEGTLKASNADDGTTYCSSELDPKVFTQP